MNRNILRHVVSIAAAFVLVIAANLAVSQFLPMVQIDLTERKLYTLSEGTEGILKNLSEPVTLRYFASKSELAGVPGIRSLISRIENLLREYERLSDGNIKLQIIEPELFSEDEDQAVGYGLQGFAVSATGELAYFGLVGTNSVDNLEVIPLFSPDREELLEYDITRMVYKLSNPSRIVVGIADSLGVAGTGSFMPGVQGARPPWYFYQQLDDLFEIKPVALENQPLPEDLDVLMLIHPRNLSDESLFQIEQFVLSGKGLVALIDPHSESYAVQTQQAPDSSMQDTGSNLNRLTRKWGIVLEEETIVGDLPIAAQVYSEDAPGQTVFYPVWMNIQPSQLNRKDVVTARLGNLILASAGSLGIESTSGVNATPLIVSTTEAMLIDYEKAVDQTNLDALLDDYASGGQEIVMAARVSGTVESSFPELLDSKKGPVYSTGVVNAIIVADTDFLQDRFWVRFQNLLGSSLAFAEASNGEFIQNAVDNLSGNEDLIGVRGRGSYFRPFSRLENIRREAEAQFLRHEQKLLEELDRVENLLVEFSSAQSDNQSGALLSDEQRAQLESARDNQLRIRQELREVRKNLREGIDNLQMLVRFMNIVLVPGIVAICGIFVCTVGVRRRSRKLSTAILNKFEIE